MTSPHAALPQRNVRADRGRPGFRRPQPEHVFEDAYHRPAVTSTDPYQPHL